MTVLSTICGDGSYLDAFFIYKGKLVMTDWSAACTIKYFYFASESGWTSNYIALTKAELETGFHSKPNWKL